MIFTARQLEELFKANGQIVLPYGARLTPLATDWIKSKKIQVGYGPDDLVKASVKLPTPIENATAAQAATGQYLWWCDGACGAAKAAVGAQARESSLAPIDVPADPRQLVPVLKTLAAAIKSGQSIGGVILVASAGAGVVLANRSPLLRAVAGSTFESLEASIAQTAANVLFIEYPSKSFSQIKNLLSRFVRAKRTISADLAQQMKEMAACA